MVRMIRFLRLMQLITHAIRAFLPWIGRQFLFMLGFIATTVAAFWGRVPAICRQIADDWLDRAVVAGFPTLWSRRLYQVFWGLAFLMLVAGWVGMSFLTVWLITLVI